MTSIRSTIAKCLLALMAGLHFLSPSVRAEVILQYFNVSWKELADKMPELAEVGYGSLWLPPPTKGSGGLSVGYDMWDPFDLGSKDQRNTVKTRYGTEAELLRLIEVAHRFGLRVYFDNIMNHRAFDVPGFNEFTPIDIYPGMVPEDFHLRVTEDGFYRKWDNVGNWNDVWEVQNRNFSDLIDIAHETPNDNFGPYMRAPWWGNNDPGNEHPKVSIVRHPNNPEFYDFHPTLGRVGFYSTNITAGLIASNQNFYKEDVGAYLMRSVRWLVDRTKVDGLRLDAVKHVPSYFFGSQGVDKDTSNAGYTGQAQEQFNITRGFLDPNHRDTVFNTELPRNDLMMFGEHLGSPPGFGEYMNAGMRLVDAPLHSHLNSVLGNPSASLAGLDQPGYSGNPDFNQFTGVMFAKSHDDDYATRPELQYGLHLSRAGIANIYTDGNYQSETLAQSGGAFPRHANTAFLGQFGDNRIPNMVYIHNQFARGDQVPKWSDSDVVAYERRDKRENGAMSDVDGTVLLFMLNDNYASGQGRPINTTFPKTPFVDDSYLYNYSSYGGGFYVYASQIANGSVIIPPGGYFAFSWRTPEESDLWKEAGGKPITIYQNGQEAGSVSYLRKDGPNGDQGFNPYGLPNRGYPTNETPAPFTYRYTVPRVTSPTNLRFVTRVDGSAYNVLMKLDGGVDINSQMGLGDTNEVAKRDNPPGIFPIKGTDMYLGYEQARFKHRQHREKFAARNTTSNNVIGSAGAETYIATIGATGFVINTGSTGKNNFTETASFVYHDPVATITASNNPPQLHFNPEPGAAAGSNITVWAKVGYACNINMGFLYYTTDGATYPEGAGGEGLGTTKVVPMVYMAADEFDGTIDWWRATIPPLTNGTQLRYKIGFYREQGGACGAPFDVPFPTGAAQVTKKKSMMTVFEVTNFNAATIAYKPHIDYGASVTGLVEGFHVLNARAFLQRDNRAALYNTFVQPFYYDAMTPTGRIVFPANDGDDLGSQEYGFVVRTDPTVREVWFNIVDSNPANDDAMTGSTNGNGTNAFGQISWAMANSVTPNPAVVSPYPDEWRFTYRNIPASGSATVYVRLREISSSTNLALNDAQGHFTTLQRLVDTMAPTQAMFVAFPPNDGDVVGTTYVMKVFFSKSLADGINEATLRSRFLIKINGAAQGQSLYSFNYNIDAFHHELAFPLPNMYNGDANYLHSIEVTHTTGGGVILQASRLVKAAPVATGPYVAIVQPPEFDSVGKPIEIVLPDVASPTPEQRQTTILVETDLSALNTWIAFANNAGSAGLLPSQETEVAGLISVINGNPMITAHEKTLTGTVSVTESNTTVTGSGTFFLSQVKAGNRLRIDSNSVVVTQVVSNETLLIGDPYPGSSGSGKAFYLQPSFDVDFHPGSTIRITNHTMVVSNVVSSSNLLLTAGYPGPTASNLVAYRVNPNPFKSAGNRLQWTFLWTNMTQGFFTFVANVDTNGNTNTVEASAIRNIRVTFRQIVDENPADDDDDDDGLSDTDETVSIPLPPGNSEAWSNGDVHRNFFSGKTDPQNPDSDGDGISDATELGLGSSIATNTDLNADTNGDGFKNFIADAHPPLYNTTDNSGHPRYDLTKSRTDLIQGTVTDPSNPDTDYDNLTDGKEDLNRNGRVEIGLLGGGVVTNIIGNPPTFRATSTIERNALPVNAVMLETDPNNGDTDGDNRSDGLEDANGNGMVDIGLVTNGVTNVLSYSQLPLYGTNIAGVISRAINRAALTNSYGAANLRWFETDPLNPDTDGDGLPDGWESQNGLDPLDSGSFNLRTGGVGNPDMGASGDPDNDGFSNMTEFLNGTHPLVPDNVPPPPAGSIIIGRGPVIGVINGVTNYQEFMDWTWDDLLALDEYEGDGSNNQQGDIYPAYDGWDTSRDIVAFYARDGGAVTNGGDGKFYFRLDFHDLQALAEQANLDIYVVIDIGSPGNGERVLPDDVDAMTEMRWEAVVAVYDSASGTVYVDTNPGQNTTAFGQSLSANGVVSQPGSFLGAYFKSDLDAVEFAISRQALIDVGWNGNPLTLNYQVFTTKDGTCNSCNNGSPGAGDIGGRNDIRDSVENDYIAEDYWQSQPGLSGANSVLYSYIGGWWQPGQAKIASIAHGNQAIQPGNIIQNLINNGQGAGYHRPLLAHEVFGQPLNLHVTPTLASAIEWAKVDTNVSPIWRDGPSFNDWIAALAQTNVVSLLASTFSDHMLPYFTHEYNRDNAALAKEFLGTIYGASFSTNSIFWTPERLLDADVFDKIKDMGYRYTVIDQMLHMRKWFGRQTALGNDGYRINRIHGVNCFVINDQANAYRFINNDNGLNLSLRRLLSRKARSATQDQVVVLMSNWEDFGSLTDANAYDTNIRWMANRPWVRIVSLEDIGRGLVPLNSGSWNIVDRGTPSISKVSHDWLHHATQENYDNWYLGSSQEEGLFNKVFQMRPGTNVFKSYGMMYFGGIVTDTWSQVSTMTDTNLAKLARGAMHASVFQTAFHNQQNNDLSKFSTGDYINPDTQSNTLASFSKQAQAQTRTAAIYKRVNTWAGFAAGVTTPQTAVEDVDLDGENEYVLYNDRLYAVFERIGGRMIGCWVRDILNGRVYQAVGNQVGYAGSETEEEGAFNVQTNGAIVAYRTSALKDFFAFGGGGIGFNNMLYNFTDWTNGWRITSTNGAIQKTVTLAPKANAFTVNYQTSGSLSNQALYIRHGLSPNLYDLLLRGQKTLGNEEHAGGVMRLANTNYETTVEAVIGYANAGNTAGFNTLAVDDNPGAGVDFYTIKMRNQAQTHQVEMVGTNNFTFSLGFRAYPSDWDGDGIPNVYEDLYPFLNPGNPGDGSLDQDGDRMLNWQEYIANTDPANSNDFLRVSGATFTNASGILVQFPSKTMRDYYIRYANNSLLNPTWLLATTNPIPGTGSIYSWLDDGTATAPHPFAATNRNYLIEVQLPK